MGKEAMWAKHHMGENRNTQYRPEQHEFYRKLKLERPKSTLLQEYTITYGNEQGVNMCAIVDIADVTKKECFRLNGAIHNSTRQEEKDWEQKIYLEQLGWKVIDINEM